MFVVKLIEAFVRIFGGVGFHRSRHVVDSGLYGACGLAGWFGSRPRGRSRRQGHRLPSGSGSSSGPPLRIGSSQFSSIGKPGPQSLPTPSSSAPPSVLRPEHAFQPYREESDDEDGYIMGAWHSYTKPGYSAVEEQAFLDPHPPPPPPKPSGFKRVGGGRAHFDTPYAIQTDSRASLDRQQAVPLHHGIPSPEPDYHPPPSPFRGRTASTSNALVSEIPQNQVVNNNPSGSGGYGGRTSGSPPSPVNGRAAGRPNLPHGAMPPAHFRVQSQSAVVITPGLVDVSSGPSGHNGSGNATRVSNVGNVSPPKKTPVRHESDDTIDSPPSTPKKKPWYRGLRHKGHSDSIAPVDEEIGLSADNNGGSASGRSFVVTRKNQGQGQTPGQRPSIAGSSGGEDSGQRKGTFVVLRGREAHSDDI